MNIVFVGLAPTLGDLGIAQGAIQDIAKRIPQASFSVWVKNPKEYRLLPELRASEVERLPVVMPGKTLPPARKLVHFLRARRAILKGRAEAIVKDANVVRFQEAHQTADLVIYQGGPAWNAEWITPGRTLMYHLLYMFAVASGVPIALAGHSFGPFGRGSSGYFSNAIAAKTLSMVSIITTRDTFSAAELSRIGISPNKVTARADTAWLLDPPAADRRVDKLIEKHRIAPPEDRPRPLIFVSLRRLQPTYGLDAIQHDMYEGGEIARFLDHIVESHADVLFISTGPFARGGEAGDVTLMRSVRKQMVHGEACTVFEDEPSPAQLKAIIGLADFMIAGRLHAGIFAMGQGVPTLSLSYGRKSQALMTEMSLPDAAYSLAHFSYDTLRERFDTLFSERDQLAMRTVASAEAMKQGAFRCMAEVLSAIGNDSTASDPRTQSGARSPVNCVI